MLHAWLASFEQTCVFYGGWWVTPLLFLLGQFDRSYFLYVSAFIHTNRSMTWLERETQTDTEMVSVARTTSPILLVCCFPILVACLLAGTALHNLAASPTTTPAHHTHTTLLYFMSRTGHICSQVSLCAYSLWDTHIPGLGDERINSLWITLKWCSTGPIPIIFWTLV